MEIYNYRVCHVFPLMDSVPPSLAENVGAFVRDYPGITLVTKVGFYKEGFIELGNWLADLAQHVSELTIKLQHRVEFAVYMENISEEYLRSFEPLSPPPPVLELRKSCSILGDSLVLNIRRDYRDMRRKLVMIMKSIFIEFCNQFEKRTERFVKRCFDYYHEVQRDQNDDLFKVEGMHFLAIKTVVKKQLTEVKMQLLGCVAIALHYTLSDKTDYHLCGVRYRRELTQATQKFYEKVEAAMSREKKAFEARYDVVLRRVYGGLEYADNPKPDTQ